MTMLKPLLLVGSTLSTLTLNKKGQLINAYSPLLNTLDDLGYISDCTTSELPTATKDLYTGLGFDLSHPVDILAQPSYDGGVNLILNDGKTHPKIVNSRFSVQEDNTFFITDHIGFRDTNLYNKSTFASESSLIPYVKDILKIEYKGLTDDAGVLKSGIYIFYFKYSDADGNVTEVQGESGLVYVHKGKVNDPQSIRFGLEDETTDKAVNFKLTNIDLAYTNIQVYFSRISGNDNGKVASVHKILTPYPVKVSGECDIIISGSESTIQVGPSEVLMTFADLGSVETQTTFGGMLLQGNVSKAEHDYEKLKQISWRIYPELRRLNEGEVGSLNARTYQDLIYGENEDLKCIYYNTKNLYYRVGYWPEEIYRFGVVYIFEDGSLSPVFDTLGVDFLETKDAITEYDLYNQVLINGEIKPEERLYEPDDGQFTNRLNSRGVVRMPKVDVIRYTDSTLSPTPLYVQFHLDHIAGLSGVSHIDIFKEHKIKGYFFVRQIRVPNIICQGLVIDHTDKDLGGLPCLKKDGRILGQSFLDSNRYISHSGDFAIFSHSTPLSFLAPDAILQTPIFNDIFTSSKCLFSPVYKFNNPVYDIDKGDYMFLLISPVSSPSKFTNPIRVTNVPDGSTVLTNGVDYFCGSAGSATDATKTSDLKYKWNHTLPQKLSQSTSVVRGLWGTYAGLEKDDILQYGQLCNVYKEGISDNAWLQNSMRVIKYSDKPYYAICDRLEYTIDTISCFRGDCFISLYTHRMFRNFIDPTYPTNNKIVDISSWRKNYAVRCSAYKTLPAKGAALNNCLKENEGWRLSATEEVDTSEHMYNEVASNFVLDAKKIGKLELKNYKYKPAKKTDSGLDELWYKNKGAERGHQKDNNYLELDPNNAWQKFWYINGAWEPIPLVNEGGNELDDGQDDSKPLFLTDVAYADDSLGKWWKYTYLNQPDPPKETGFALIDFAVQMGHANSHEFIERRSNNINLADLNSVGLGQWITFPICSNLNIAMRDIDFRSASEEALFNEKRAFFPYKEKNKFSKLSDSYCINNVLKNSIPTQQYKHIPNVVFFKQEFFNRIYYSFIDSASTNANEWKLILTTNFVDYSKEYGVITKIIDNGNNVYVIFEHGIGAIPFKVNEDGSLGIGALQVIDSTYGSMWKDSIITTDVGIFGVDTVAKAIWKLVGDQVSIVSTRTINKFLIDNIDLSETVKYPYVGHVNVKTHYNKNKHDVIFTYYNDIPYILPKDTGIVDINNSSEGIDIDGNIVLDPDGNPYIILKFESNWNEETEQWERLQDQDNILWKKGIQWSICYNLELQLFSTFYDWIPLESANIDNVFFSFDKDQVDKLSKIERKLITFENQTTDFYKINKHTVDPSLIGVTNKYIIPKTVYTPKVPEYTHYSFYLKITKPGTPVTITFTSGDITTYNLLPVNTWIFFYGKWVGDKDFSTSIIIDAPDCEICDFVLCNLPSENIFEDPIIPDENGIFDLNTYHLRDSGNRMYLWKHGQTGIYDNEGVIRPTHWYGNQHEFNFEFVVNDSPYQQKIFENLKMLANKTSPDKFEFEIVGEGYEWFEFKPIVEWINKKHLEDPTISLDDWFKKVLGDTSKSLSGVYPDFPLLTDEYRVIKKLPYLKLKHTDKKGTPERPHYTWETPSGTDYWAGLSSNIKEDSYSYNCSEPCLIADSQLNETRVKTELLGNDMRKYGRVRGNMQYLEDLWNVEIRPVQIPWCYKLSDGSLGIIKMTETKHRDKYIKIRVRYSGEDLAIILSIITYYNESYA